MVNSRLCMSMQVGKLGTHMLVLYSPLKNELSKSSRRSLAGARKVGMLKLCCLQILLGFSYRNIIFGNLKRDFFL